MSNYAWCERVTATPTSPIHIRTVGPEGLKESGGAPDTTLCGAPLYKGWDLRSLVTTETVRRYVGIPQNQPGRCCLPCTDAWSAKFLQRATDRSTP